MNILNAIVKVVTLNNPPYIAIPLLKGAIYKLLYAIKLISIKLFITILENNIDLSRLMVTAFEINKKINKKIYKNKKKIL